MPTLGPPQPPSPGRDVGLRIREVPDPPRKAIGCPGAGDASAPKEICSHRMPAGMDLLLLASANPPR